jgi:hypothetical protein
MATQWPFRKWSSAELALAGVVTFVISTIAFLALLATNLKSGQ